MSRTLVYVAPHDLPQLHDELLAAGIAPERVEGGPVTRTETAGAWPHEHTTVTVEPTVWLTVPDGQAQAPVDAVVAAHVPRVRYDPATRLRAVEALRRTSARQALVERARAAQSLPELRDVLVAHLRAEQEGAREEAQAG